MDTQRAIEKLLQNFTKELMKVFSDSVVRAVGQVTHPGRSSLPAAASAPARRGPRARKAAPAPTAKAKPGRPPGRPVGRPPGRPAKGSKPAGRKGKVEKSSPAEVDDLSNDILAALRRSDRNLASREIMLKLELKTLDAGRFNYALNKLKDDGRVAQHGDRRMARYGLGSGAKAKPGRKPNASAAETVTESEAPGEAPAAEV